MHTNKSVDDEHMLRSIASFSCKKREQLAQQQHLLNNQVNKCWDPLQVVPADKERN